MLQLLYKAIKFSYYIALCDFSPPVIPTLAHIVCVLQAMMDGSLTCSQLVENYIQVRGQHGPCCTVTVH